MNSQINEQQNAATKKTEVTAFVYEARKFQTSLYVISVAPKRNEKGTMGQKSVRSSSCQNTGLSLILIQESTG